MENWRTVPGHPNYLVSDMGNVKSIFSKGICLKYENTKGYHRVRVAPKVRILVHRLVMLAFVGPPPEGHEVNHINGVRNDNRLENLEYVTKSYNQWHSNHVTKLRTSQKGSAHGRSKITETIVCQIRLRRKEGNSLQSIADEFSVCIATVSMIANRKIWRHI